MRFSRECFKIYIMQLPVVLAALAVMPDTAAAQVERLVKGAPAQLTPLRTPSDAPAADGPLTVRDVIVDKTAENAVLARKAAMTEAQRQAFRKLAEKYMSPEDLKNFTLPADQTIATLVQDFEITGEKLSRTRYVGRFTVRFRDAAARYLNIYVPPPAGAAAVAGMDATGWVAPEDAAYMTEAGTTVISGTTPKPVEAAHLRRSTLVLPYFENISGETVLWEENNPWRAYWQAHPPRTRAGSALLTLPLGDIGDLSSGPANAVWSGDYSAVEKLRKSYKVDQVALAVANRSGTQLTVDVYIFDGVRLHQRRTLTLYAGENSPAQGWQQGMQAVLDLLQRPDTATSATVENISRGLVNGTRTASAPPPPAVTIYQPAYNNGLPVGATSATHTELDATLSFRDFSAWMDAQKRLAGMTPPVRIDIRGLTRDTARFTMRYDGGIETLRRALVEQGLVLRDAAGGYAGRPAYALEFIGQ